MKLSADFVDPSLYDDYRLSHVPGTVLSMLTGERSPDILPPDALKGLYRDYDQVLLFLVDGFGWTEFSRLAARLPFMQQLVARGATLKLVSQFPSTTACNVTTLNTGLSVANHGLYEWFYYEPKVDDIIAPLLYSYAREQKIRGTLNLACNVGPKDLYPATNIYQKLASLGIQSFAFQNIEYAESTYSEFILRPATIKGFENARSGLAALARTVARTPGKAYFYFYYDGIDLALHHDGPGSIGVKAAVDEFFKALEAFWKTLEDQGGTEDIAFILTADHGQTAIDPSRTIYLNQAVQDLEPHLKRNRKGRLLVPAGSCRDMFLYIREEAMEEACALLQEKLVDRAIVCPTADLIRAGYFGRSDLSEALQGRLGNLVVLPLDGESVWWYVPGVFEVGLNGHHGGLTPAEMEIPFLIWTR